LGRLNPGRFLGGEMGLDVPAAAEAFDRGVGKQLGLSPEQAALAVVNIAVNIMGLAVRSVSIERGVDPRDCALIAFGGAGPLHACAVARELKIPRVIVPMLPGHFSALGMLLADIRHELVRTIYSTTDDVSADVLTGVANEMSDDVTSMLTLELIAEQDQDIELFLDLRYRGQEFTIRTPCGAAELRSRADLEKVRQRFDELHELRFGHSSSGSTVEIVNVRVVGIGRRERIRPTISATAGEPVVTKRRVIAGTGSQAVAEDWNIYQREQLPVGYEVRGPAVIEEYASTIVLDANDVATVGPDGALDIRVDTGAKNYGANA
jgi:N-methylhydantoinase A